MMNFLKNCIIVLCSILLITCSSDNEIIKADKLQYLSFQMFASGTTDPTDELQTLLPLRPKSELENFIQLVSTEIGTIPSNDFRKLAVMIGPIAINHSDADIKKLIDDSFDLALQYNMAVGFHLDDGMYWGGRTDLTTDPENIEWQDWNGTLSESRYVDWVGGPLAPQMCFNAPKVLAAKKVFLEHIGLTIKKNLNRPEFSDKENLFAGVIAGWETSLDQETDTRVRLGYHALKNRGFSEDNLPTDIDLERYDIVKEYIEFLCTSLIQTGLSQEKVYSHVAVFPKLLYDQLTENNPEGAESYLAINGFAIPESSVSANFQAGFSTYPLDGVFDQLYALENGNLTNWISAEGTNMILGNPPIPTGYTMESYLARHYNHGASMVNLFSFGLRGGTFVNALNDATQSTEALMAYRKFLTGETLIE